MHKLRSVYDALDMGQNQQALKQCNQILKKKPDLPLVKALKALSLVRTGSVAEGLALCRSVQNGTPPPTEESILNAMLLVYKQTGNLAEMCKCYEVAWQVDPKNEELATGVFFSYVRVSNFAKQQQIAMKLFKQFPKDGYYIWAVVSTYLQGQLNNNPPLSQLAEKMMDKVVAENKIKTSETLLFYIYMLSQSGKYEKVIELLSGQLGVSLLSDAIPGERIHMLANLLTKTNKIEEANKLYYERIQEGPDDWAAYTGYLDSLFEIKKAQQKDSSSEAREFFQSFQSLPKQIRGPFLAEIDLESRLFVLGEQKVDVVVDLLSKYFEKFGAKACCVYDILAYLKHIPQDGRLGFVDHLRTLIPPQPHTTTIPIQQSLAVHQISRMLGLHQKLTQEGKVSLIRTLLSEYMVAISLGPQREPSERIVGDDLILLIVHILEELSSEEGGVQRLCEAATLLEWARSVSKTNFQFLLHLIDIYKKLEAYKPIAAIWPLLSVRYIQLDTLLHVVLDDAIQLGFHQQIIPVLEQFWKFHDHSGGTPDSIVQAYSHHSYSKIKEFLDFKSRLEHSHQLAIVKTEQIFISLYNGELSLQRATSVLQSTNAQEVSIIDDNFLQNLSSNQDVNSIDRWDPLDQERAPFPRDKKLAELKQRRLILVMLTSITTDNTSQFQTAYSVFSTFTASNTSTNNFDSVIAHSTLALFDAHSSFLLANTQEQEEKTFQDKVNNLCSSLQNAQEHIKSTICQMSSPRITVFYRYGVELLCWVSLVVHSWVEHYKKKAKKEKKEWVKTTLEPFITALHDLDTTLASFPFQDYQVPEHTNTFDTLQKELQLGAVLREINASHKQSHATLATIITTRAKALSTIKL
eukprot:Phypoly_transcript_00829.p1 GENE.Phypoly_transcript_00829~~Phypoly_transcript_00829.p1  ORF type:complete len:861 (+),score=124.38 Phypoly_transcript_00829:1022-3604(+)